ncbi:uncharacterized protein LOC125478111 [Pyrus x bretschneideri]|uniref:uncharacterized protein LOC125478111 n=1 Tax=Pyrus x bretschneideri TaxID=225117 RepID=UPI00202FA374|nr:uncharacterized protein LOC125478111 [Pyrus x bretschneideri]
MTHRNVLKATIDVPEAGEVNFHCTHLHHLGESWRMRPINAIMQSSNEPHILAGGLNSLDESDYSQERWTDIVKYYEDMGKPRPKVEVMRYLKSKQYTDAKDFEGEYESVVMIAKGQNLGFGLLKEGQVLAWDLHLSPTYYEDMGKPRPKVEVMRYLKSKQYTDAKDFEGEYESVVMIAKGQSKPTRISLCKLTLQISSNGTSDHHIVRVDVVKVGNCGEERNTEEGS